VLTYIESGGESPYLEKILHYLGPDFLLRNINNEELGRAARALYPETSQNTVQRQPITPVSSV